ncbi:uncharacterized protein LOC106013382 [Aplysia californica]|uniref:Uncharacterized protein LOC106013382 n=1 Tax=Aplysia californica TaxID=6500 RepID=A0ABM1ABA3_APLCA|nr:uncharacterized protein LOC106013382 [Aplysia californica]
MVLQISDSPQPTPSKIHNANHNTKLDQLMKAYDNSAFDAEEGDETEVMGKPAVGNGHYRSPSASYTTGTTSIPGLNEEVQEGVTRFADEILSRDSGYPDGPLQYNSTHLDYTDI